MPRLEGVLENLVADNVHVTIREAARRHPELKNASALTRNPLSMALLDNALRRQAEVRAVVAELQTSHATMVDGNETQRARIATLDANPRNGSAAPSSGRVRPIMAINEPTPNGGMRVWIAVVLC
jgi:hypothetical protein